MKEVSLRNTEISGLYAITPDTENTQDLLHRVRQALDGGVRLLQYRNKLASESLLREQAAALAQLCRQYQIPLIINDHLQLAISVDADGVHLGSSDGSIQAAREEWRKNKIIGASCYNQLDLAVLAEEQGADYIAFGAFFPSSTKPAVVSVPADLMQIARQKVTVPIIGIGGIQLSNVELVINSGCAAVAVCADLFQSADIRERASRYSCLFQNFSKPIK